MKPTLRLLLLVLAWSAFGPPRAAQAQQGSDGDVTVSTTGRVVNAYTDLTGNVAAGATSISVNSSALSTNFSGNLAAGDLVMIIQMQGATMTTGATSAAYGTVSAYNNAGLYELLEVKSVNTPTANTIQFYCGTTNSYTVAGNAQVIRVPRYNTLTVSTGNSIVATAWNGTVGGVVAVEVKGNITLAGTGKIDVSGQGFRGGAVNNNAAPSANAIFTDYASTVNTSGGIKGESIVGTAADYDGLNGRYGRGAPANGGGGGNTHNSGGGGGANVGAGTWTGFGNPAAGYTNAWRLDADLESVVPGASNAETATSSGGGRGGYTYSNAGNTTTNPGTVGPGDATWGGNKRQNVGGLGGHPLETSTNSRLYLGGGGGSGNSNDGGGTAGGDGGGLIYVLAGGNITTSGTNAGALIANGDAAVTSGAIDGPGGGGGGGTIVLNTTGTATGIALSAQGGKGGIQASTTTEAEGPGGGGGGGNILYTAVSGGSLNVAAGLNGTTTSTAMTLFPPNGATIGGAGVTGTITYAAQCAIVTDVVTTVATTQTTVPSGTTITYTVRVQNNGSGIATGVAPTLQLPAGLTNAAFTNLAGGTYNNTTGLLTLPTTNSLASTANVTYAVSFTAPNYTTTITGVAQSASTSNDPTLTNNNGSNATNAQVSTVVTLPVNGCTGTPYATTATSGLYAEYYKGYFGSLANKSGDDLSYFVNNTPGIVRTDRLLNYVGSDGWGNLRQPTANPTASNSVDNPDFYSARYRGSINIATAGAYTFTLASDDASYLWFDGPALEDTPTRATATVDNGGLHGQSSVSGTITLSAGLHNMLVFFGENDGQNTLTLSYAGPGITGTIVVPTSVLCATRAPIADLATAITGPATAAAGQTVYYVANTANVGDATAASVVTTITLPNKPAANTVTTTGTYDPATGIVTFNNGTLAAGATVVNTVAFVAQASPTSVTGQAISTSAAPIDAVFANNNGTATNANVTTTITAPTATACANPGKDGPGVSTNNLTNLTTLSTTADPVTYYPGTDATVNAGTSTLTVGTATGAGTAITAGDLLLVIQMQGAEISSDNNDKYGDGLQNLPANGVISNASYLAGQYEYAVVQSIAGSTVTLSAPLRNSYANVAGSTTVAQKRYQVVRVPQLGNLTLNSDITVTPWNGTSGGVFAVDVAGTLNFNGKTINATGAGFRGGATFNAALGSANAANAGEFVLNSTATAQKGEGTAGTPASVANAAGTISTTGVDYVGGSAGRGAPGNGGGAGTRGSTAIQFENAGGAGGSNAGTGGRGGNTYTSNQPLGGEPGAAFAVFSPNRLVLGGGGGAGDENDNVGTSGAPGGGMVLVRAGNATGTGIISANGANALSGANDGAGGGGAGGSVLITVDRGTLSTVTVNAQGGNGGNAVYTITHGTGGGGGGGVIFANAVLSASNASGGTPGTSNGSTDGAGVGLSGAGPTGTTGQGTFGPTNLLTAPVNNSVAGATCNDVPVATNDFATTTPGTAVTFTAPTLLGNDVDAIGGLYAASVDLNPSTAAQTKTRTIAGVGTWTVNAATGALTFTPLAGFVGVATIPYFVYDIYGRVSNQAIATVTVENPRSDLSTTITSTPASGGSVTAGALVPYSVVATNNTGTGLGAATGVVQTVQLQAGLLPAQLTITGSTGNTTAGNVITYTGGTFAGATYNQTTGLLTFPAVALAAGGTQTYTFSAAAPNTGPFTVLAQVGNGNVDPTPANNSASTTLSVTDRKDLATYISGPTTNPTAGDLVSYAVSYANLGNLPATAVVPTMQLPTTLTNVYLTNGGVYNATNANATYDYNGTNFVAGTTYTVPAGGVIFPPITLAPGQSANNVVSFAAPTVANTIINVSSTFTTATLTGDAVGGNNTAAATARTTQAPAGTPANVRTTLTAVSNAVSVAPGTVAAGATVTYTATAYNDGQGSAADVQEVVSLPAGLTPATLAISGSTGNSTTANVITYTNATVTVATYNQLTGVLTFPAAGSLAQQATKAYTFSVVAPNSPTLLAVASVSTSSADLVTGDNVASTMTTIAQGTDLSMTLQGPTTTLAGQQMTYLATTTNNGPISATAVVQTVTIAPGLLTSTSDNNTVKINGSFPTAVNTTTGVATYAGGTTYDPRSGVVTFGSVATLASGAIAQNSITYLAPATATVANVAAVRSTTPDSNPTNNLSTVTATTTAAADVVVALTGPATATVGAPVTYVATTTNNGGSVATGTTVPTMQLPAGLTATIGGNTLRVNGLAPTSVNGAAVATYADGSTYDPATGLVTFPSIVNQVPGAAASVVNTATFVAPDYTKLNVVAAANPAGTTGDRNLDNNSDNMATTLTGSALGNVDLAVTITTPTVTATAGQFMTYTVTASNLASSPTAGTNVRTQATIPAGLATSGANAVQIGGIAPTSVDAAGVASYTVGGNTATYDPATGIVTFPTIGTLAAGASSPGVTVRIAAPGTGPFIATANVRSDNAEVNTADNVFRVSVGVTASADLATAISGPLSTATGGMVAYTVTTTNTVPATAGTGGGSPAVGATQTITIPANVATGAPVVSGPGTAVISGSATTGYTIVISYGTLNLGQANAVSNTVSFTAASAATYTISAAASTTGTGATTDAVAANNPASQQTTISATPPVADDIVNNGRTGTNAGTSPIGNRAGQVAITSLAATAGSSAIASYNITAIPTVGTLYVNNVAVTAPRPLILLEAAQLTYDPATTGTQEAANATTLYSGNASFLFTATDGNGTASNTARYVIPVNQDNSSTYAATTIKGINAYNTDDVLAYTIDPNGAQYTTGALVYNAGGSRNPTATDYIKVGTSGIASVVRPTGTTSGPAAVGTYPANPTNVLPSGVSLDPATGLIYVSDRTLLVNSRTVQYYQINVVTTDIYGGTNTVLAQFAIGAYPLPVELVDFTAKAVKNLDAQLDWRTASEKNNDHFDVERSLDGTTFVKIAQVKGQGSTSAATAYALTDANIGTKANGAVYYRLRQVDTNGEASFSPVRTVSFTAAGLTPAIALFPNPATSGTQLDLTQLPTGRYQVSVLDATGRVVLASVLESGLAHALDLNTIASGTYTVLVRGQNNGQVIALTKRLIKE